MTTRLQLRTTIREILEDTTGAPLWSDAALNEYLAAGMRAYGVRFPRQATAATEPIPTGLIQAGSAWEGTLRLRRRAAGDEVGVWAIDYLTGRGLAGDDVSQQPI